MIIEMYSFSIKTERREQFIPVTERINDFIWKSEGKIKLGICKIFIPHTTGAITLNQNVNPDVIRDFHTYLADIAPHRRMLNVEGNSDAHLKSSFFGSFLEIPIEKGKLALGSWQDVFFAEFDGPRTRTIKLQIWGQ